MLYYGPRKSAFAIKYKVQARMEENAESSQSTLKPIKAKQRINVHQSITEQPTHKKYSVEKNIKTFFFVRQGPTKVDIDLEKESWYSNDMAILNCTIDNTRCDKDIKGIKVKIRRIVQGTSMTTSKKYEDNTLILAHEFPGVRHHRKDTKRIEVDLRIFADVERRVKKVHKKKKKPFSELDIEIQQEMVATTQTTLIKVSYVAEVHLYHSGATWKSKFPPTELPIKIFSAKSVEALKAKDRAPEVPAGWQPKVYKNLAV